MWLPRQKMPFQEHFWKIMVALVVGLVLLRVPIVRRVVIFILPLGRNIDDVLFWIFFFSIIVVAFVRGWVAIPAWFSRDNDKGDY